MSTVETAYANTDLDLISKSAIETLISELDQSCAVVCTPGDDGRWYTIVESSLFDETDAAKDITAILTALSKLSAQARAEFELCEVKDFNIGIECWDTWSYRHALPNDVLQAIANSGCTLSITLYPMRNPDGTPKV